MLYTLCMHNLTATLCLSTNKYHYSLNLSLIGILECHVKEGNALGLEVSQGLSESGEQGLSWSFWLSSMPADENCH